MVAMVIAIVADYIKAVSCCTNDHHSNCCTRCDVIIVTLVNVILDAMVGAVIMGVLAVEVTIVTEVVVLKVVIIAAFTSKLLWP